MLNTLFARNGSQLKYSKGILERVNPTRIQTRVLWFTSQVLTELFHICMITMPHTLYIHLYSVWSPVHNNNNNTLLPLLIRCINHSWNLLSSQGSIQLNCCHFGTYRANQTQQPTVPSQVPIYSWVERSNYGKVSCRRTQAPWLQPGFEPTFWRLGHQNTNPMH